MADSQIEEIKARLNIAELIGQYVQLQRAGRTLRARCPFHKEKTPSFFVSPERGTYICFGCGEKGDAFSFLEKIEGLSFSEALSQLAERTGVVLERRAPPNPEHQDYRERLFAVCEAATAYYQSQLSKNSAVQTYLHSRAVSDVTVSQWRIGYAPAEWEALCQHLRTQGFTDKELVEAGLAIRSDKKQGELYDRFRGRVMFPISDANGRVIAFSGRFFEKVHGSHEEGEPAKYVNSPETELFKKSRALYGYDKAKSAIRKLDCILLVEGQFDVIMSHQSGLPFTVALSGTALTPEHMTLLGRLSKRLVLALDADEAGIRSGLKSALMAIQEGFDVKIPSFVGGKDPADIARESADALKDAIRHSKTAVEYFLDVFRGQAKDERSYKKLVELSILPLIAALPSRIEQAHFISLVALRLGIPESAVTAEVEKIGRGDSRSESFTDASSAPSNHTISARDKAAAMILFHFDQSSSAVARLTELLGPQTIASLQETLGPRAEEIRFEFDLLHGEESAIAKELLQTIERGVLDERLTVLQQQIRSTPNATLLSELAQLKRKQEELRTIE